MPEGKMLFVDKTFETEKKCRQFLVVISFGNEMLQKLFAV